VRSHKKAQDAQEKFWFLSFLRVFAATGLLNILQHPAAFYSSSAEQCSALRCYHRSENPVDRNAESSSLT
jgi:hypothetical protein